MSFMANFNPNPSTCFEYGHTAVKKLLIWKGGDKWNNPFMWQRAIGRENFDIKLTNTAVSAIILTTLMGKSHKQRPLK